MTNVSGPREVVYLAGTPVQAVLVWAPTSGSVGMSVSIFSYRGQVTIGLTVDAGLVPDPQGDHAAHRTGIPYFAQVEAAKSLLRVAWRS